MKFSTVLVSFVAAAGFVAAQSSTSSAPIPTNTSSYDKATVACLDACDEADVNCRAACFGNPHPDEDAANATTQCAMKCDQGSGSPEDTEKYAKCQQDCIKTLFLTTTGGISKPTPSGSSTTTAGGSSASGDADSDNDSTDDSSDNSTDDSTDDSAENDDTSEGDQDSAAGKLAASAGGAIVLALVAFAL